MWLKNVYSHPLFGVFGAFGPLNGEWYQQKPQKAHPCMESGKTSYDV